MTDLFLILKALLALSQLEITALIAPFLCREGKQAVISSWESAGRAFMSRQDK